MKLSKVNIQNSKNNMAAVPLRTLLEGDELESFAGERDDVLLFDGELEDDSFEEGV